MKITDSCCRRGGYILEKKKERAFEKLMGKEQ